MRHKLPYRGLLPQVCMYVCRYASYSEEAGFAGMVFYILLLPALLIPKNDELSLDANLFGLVENGTQPTNFSIVGRFRKQG
jgi:hypothetical protein